MNPWSAGCVGRWASQPETRGPQEKTRQGIPAAESTMTFGDYLTCWLATIPPQRLKPSTLNSNEGLTRLYIRPALGKKRLNRLSPADVRRFLAEFKDSCLCCRGVRTRSVRRASARAAPWAVAASVARPPGPSSTSMPSSGPRCNRRFGKS
ncbi:hypothetical protein TNCT6_31200 [Streptomyces sp. 6-11-2]|nr:hypothetical protein TNCT6_31200 [Streptomyces sp. 6-11-2]